MVAYTDTDVINESARLVRGRLEVNRSGGLIDVADAYGQLRGMVSLTLLLNPEGIFYLAGMAVNQLRALVKQEVELTEDMLVAVDYLSKIGEPVTNTTALSNAMTALLNMESVGSVSGRPETAVFTRNMNLFLRDLRKNVAIGDQLALPRDEARSVLQRNLAKMKIVHANLLASLDLMVNMVDRFKALDVPTKVSATAFANIRSVLQSMQDEIEVSSGTDTIARSRAYALKSFSSKAVVNLISSFGNPSSVKYRSPVNPVPAGLTHQGRVIGQGDAAVVTTTPGPWPLPMTDLLVAVDGGVDQPVSLAGIVGVTFNGRSSGDFTIDASNNQLYAVVDPRIESISPVSSTITSITVAPTRSLGFKHLGMPIMFPSMNTTDQYARPIDGFGAIASGTGVTWDPATNTLGLSSAVLLPQHVGMCVTLSFFFWGTFTFEITEVLTASTCKIDPRNVFVIGFPFTQWQLSGVLATDPSGTITFSSSPLTTAAYGRALVGPAVKVGVLSLGTQTAAAVVADLSSENPLGVSAFNALITCFSAQVNPTDPTRVRLSLRNALEPQAAITSVGLMATGAAPLQTLQISAHRVLGFLDGEYDEDRLLTPRELMTAVNGSVVGAHATTSTEVLVESTAQQSQGSDTLTDTAIDLLAAGVVAGCRVQVLEGPDAGTYVIDTVTSASMALRLASFSSNRQVAYRVEAERVSITSGNTGAGSSIKVSQSPVSLGLDSQVYHGGLYEFEAVTTKGEQLTFTGVVAGDQLRVTGYPAVEILVNNGATLTLASSLPANVKVAPFEILGASSRLYDQLVVDVKTILSSPDYLGAYGLNKSLDQLDIALTTAVSPGQQFTSDLNRIRVILVALLSSLTSTPLRTSEYNAIVPTKPLSLDGALSTFSAAKITEIDDLLDALLDRKYDRAARLLTTGDIDGFYESTEETASYSGNFLSKSRNVVNDLPDESRSEYNVELKRMVPTREVTVPDAMSDFSDATFDQEGY